MSTSTNYTGRFSITFEEAAQRVLRVCRDEGQVVFLRYSLEVDYLFKALRLIDASALTPHQAALLGTLIGLDLAPEHIEDFGFVSTEIERLAARLGSAFAGSSLEQVCAEGGLDCGDSLDVLERVSPGDVPPEQLEFAPHGLRHEQAMAVGVMIGLELANSVL